MNKRCIILLLAMLIAVTLCGCSDEPIWYTDKEIKNYVKNTYGSSNKFIEKETITESEDGTDIEDEYIYHYKTKDGIKFNVRSYTYLTGMKGSTWWEKGRDCNYEEAILKHYEDDILEELCESDVVEVTLDEEVINIYVGDYKNLYKIADNIANVDKFIGFNIVSGDNEPMFRVYCRATDGSQYEAAEIEMSTGKYNRLSKKEVTNLIEESLVTEVHIDNYYGITSVDLDRELLRKYKPKYMNVALNGKLTEIRLTYDDELETYTIGQLSFQDDYDGEFMYIVQELGGTYEIEGSWADCNEVVHWTLGDTQWEALYHYDMSSKAKLPDGFTVYKNNKLLELSDIGFSDAYDLYREYTLEDLTKLLNVKIGIDYDDYVVNLKTK